MSLARDFLSKNNGEKEGKNGSATTKILIVVLAGILGIIGGFYTVREVTKRKVAPQGQATAETTQKIQTEHMNTSSPAQPPKHQEVQAEMPTTPTVKIQQTSQVKESPIKGKEESKKEGKIAVQKEPSEEHAKIEGEKVEERARKEGKKEEIATIEKKKVSVEIKSPLIKKDLKAVNLTEEADSYMKSGDVAKAADLYREALKLNPNNKKALLNLSAIYFQIGNIQSSKKLLKRLIRLDPSCKDAYNNLAVIYMQEGKIKEAIALLNKVLEMDPMDKSALFNISVAYEKEGMLKKALDHLKKGIQLYPKEYRFYLSMGVIYYNKGNIDEAYTYLSKAYELMEDKSSDIASTLRRILEK